MSEKFFEDVLALIEGPRDQKYGDSTENHTRIAAMWSVLLNKKITVQEVYLCLIAIKLSRLTTSQGFLAGYCWLFSSGRKRMKKCDFLCYVAIGAFLMFQFLLFFSEKVF